MITLDFGDRLPSALFFVFDPKNASDGGKMGQIEQLTACCSGRCRGPTRIPRIASHGFTSGINIFTKGSALGRATPGWEPETQITFEGRGGKYAIPGGYFAGPTDFKKELTVPSLKKWFIDDKGKPGALTLGTSAVFRFKACNLGTEAQQRKSLRASLGSAKVFASRVEYRASYGAAPAAIRDDVFANIAKRFFKVTDADGNFVKVEKNGPEQTAATNGWTLEQLKVGDTVPTGITFTQVSELKSIDE